MEEGLGGFLVSVRLPSAVDFGASYPLAVHAWVL